MGADIYLKTVFDGNKAQFEPLFKEAVALRDSLPKGSIERSVAQEKVYLYFDQMYSKGYFRDSYNVTNFLWLCDLSWWADVGPMLDEDSNLAPLGCAILLGTLYQRMKEVFPLRLAERRATGEFFPDDTDEELGAAFREDFESLTGLLRMAIDLNEPLYCSI